MSSKTEKPTKPQAPSKIDGVIALLKNEQGATLDELVAATRWQPHSARAVLTGLKKKGHIIVREKLEGTSRYRIAEAASA
jgi:hypothetical protein